MDRRRTDFIHVPHDGQPTAAILKARPIYQCQPRSNFTPEKSENEYLRTIQMTSYS
jgi:hypothetical protein